MIVKSLTRKSASFGSLLEYMTKDAKAIPGKNGFVLLHNIKGTKQKWVQHFEENERNRIHHRSNNVRVYHEVISFNKKDTPNITMSTLKDIARNYIRLRNNDALSIAVPHQDKDHLHIHFAFSGVEHSTGLASRISRDQFKEVKQKIQQYQMERYPKLSNSIVNHGEKGNRQKNDREFQLSKRTKQPSEKERVRLLLDKLYGQSRSKEEFYKRIEDNGHKIYERGGKNYGIEGGRRMRFSTLGFDDKKIEMLDATMEFEKLRNPEIDHQKDDKELNDSVFIER